MILKPRRIVRLGRGQEGAAAVEFALCLIPLMLIVCGLIDFGQLWYLQSGLTIASREGAHYATRYTVDGANQRLIPSQADVESYVKTNYAGLLPSNATDLEVKTDDSQTGMRGVTVSATMHWLFLHFLSPPTLHSKTVMSVE